MNKLCALCGEPLPIGKHGRKYHSRCAKIVEYNRQTQLYAQQHGGMVLTCRGCGKEFLSTKAHRQFCPVCKRKSTWR